MENKPKVLYQYRPPKKWAFRNLRWRSLYFNAPWNFNDPYDFLYPSSLHNMTGEDFDFLKDHYENDKDARRMSGEPKEKYIIRLEGIIKGSFAKLREKIRFSCFSENCDNLPMWSHYGGRGAGFCLAFDTQSKLLCGDLAKVAYRQYMPDASDAVESLKIIKGHSRDTIYSYTTMHKPKGWEYENEWRLAMKVEDKQQQEYRDYYAAEAITDIYLGTEASNITQAKICAIANEKYQHVKLWKGKISKTQYKIEFCRLR